MTSLHPATVSRSLARLISATFILAFLPQTISAQRALTARYFEGVWRVSKVVSAGVSDTTPQPALAIFSRGYYSVTRVTSNEPRRPSPPPANPAQLTDAEKIARYDEWAPFIASAGTYEVRGDTLVTHNIVAKNARGMTLTEVAIIRALDGSSFVVSGKPAASPNGPERLTTYTRVR